MKTAGTLTPEAVQAVGTALTAVGTSWETLKTSRPGLRPVGRLELDVRRAAAALLSRLDASATASGDFVQTV